MLCTNGKQIIADEMKVLLEFVLKENGQLEKERNDLKSLYYNRPAEEKNLVKDILFMHNEFDMDLNRLKEIVDKISVIPSTNNQKMVQIEYHTKEIVCMQAKLVEKHNVLKKLLLQKINCQKVEADILSQTNAIKSQNEKTSFKIIEIKNFENFSLYHKKVSNLKEQIQRLKEISKYADAGKDLDSSLPETLQGPSISEKQAAIQLNKLVSENRALEESICNYNNLITKGNQYSRNKKIFDLKKKKVSELKEKYNKICEKIDEMENIKDDECTKKLKILDSIIGRRTSMPGKSLSPKSVLLNKKNNLLQDIEASLSRVRSIASPQPRSDY
jgi:hypothetical protein